MNKNIFIGKHFDMLKVISFAGVNKYGENVWTCRCDCGKIVDRQQKTLENPSRYHSCGCKEAEYLTPGNSERCSKAGRRRAEVRNKDGINIDMLDNNKNISTNTSGHKGVSWNMTAHKWHVYVGYKNYKCTLGFFEDFEDAVSIKERACKAIEDKTFEEFFYNLRGFRIEEKLQKQEKKKKSRGA